MSELKIALIQLYSKPLDVAHNFANAESFIRRAAQQGAHIAVLPEYHLHSWTPSPPSLLQAARQSSAYLSKYQSLARELAIAIVPGTVLEQDSDEIVNVAYFLGPGGDVLGRYGKKNLWHPERPVIRADEGEHVPFDTPWGRVGLLICWDLAFPEAARELVHRGARIIVCPACWYDDAYARDSERVFVESVVVARACENTCAFVFCNAGGPGRAREDTREDAEVKFLGLSMVGMPLLGALGKMGAEEAMAIVDVRDKTLDDAEQAYKVRADLATEAWHYAHTIRKMRNP